MKDGYALYDADANELEVIRPGESVTRRFTCLNLNPGVDKVHGIQVEGDNIWILVGPRNNPRPNRKFLYKFSTLSGGSSRLI